MPLINDRIAFNSQPSRESGSPIFESHSPGAPPLTQLSPSGNPAPNRGIVPIGNMYDFQISRFNPDTPYFVRGNVDTNLFTNNLALQAYTLAGGKIG
jgi:hypothetical protein